MSNRKKALPPSFSGNYMPANVTVDVGDDIGAETTRRIGGVGVVPIFHHFEMAAAGPSLQSDPSFSTAPQKVATILPPQSMRHKSPEPEKKNGWKLNDAPVLPEFHPLERSAVFVPRTKVSEVAQRISEVLRDRSIAATYDNVKAKASCSTPDQVEFRIRLYRGRNQYCHGIIVEVQRRFGSSASFHDDTAAILEAAEGRVPPLAIGSKGNALPLVSDSEDDYNDTRHTSSLDFVAKMLNCPDYDARHLALGTLATLTDPAKMGRKTSRNISKELLDDDSDVGSKIISLVVDTKLDYEETFGLRVQAILVLANAINAVRGNVSMFLRERLRSAIITDLRNAEANPQMAYLAARCIEPLLQDAHSESEIHAALEVARAVGESRHATLKRQAEICIQKIEMQ